MVKVRDEGHIQNKATYVVLGVNVEGQKEVLGLWVAQTEARRTQKGHSAQSRYSATATDTFRQLASS